MSYQSVHNGLGTVIIFAVRAESFDSPFILRLSKDERCRYVPFDKLRVNGVYKKASDEAL